MRNEVECEDDWHGTGDVCKRFVHPDDEKLKATGLHFRGTSYEALKLERSLGTKMAAALQVQVGALVRSESGVEASSRYQKLITL